MTNTTATPKRCTVTKLACNAIENQMNIAKYELSMPSSTALLLLPNFVRCVYRLMLYVALPESFALSLRCVLTVYLAVKECIKLISCSKT